MNIEHRATLILCLLLISSCGQGESLAAATRTTLIDVDKAPHSAFSLRAGRAVAFGFGDGPESESPKDFDLIFDLPNGLGTNNSELTPNFTGSGGIVGLGEIPLEDVRDAPESGYKPGLKPSELIPGHSYCVRVGDGLHYAKIRIIALDEEKETLEFEWQYQPKDTRSF